MFCSELVNVIKKKKRHCFFTNDFLLGVTFCSENIAITYAVLRSHLIRSVCALLSVLHFQKQGCTISCGGKGGSLLKGACHEIFRFWF
jgi:hypothetical protein